MISFRPIEMHCAIDKQWARIRDSDYAFRVDSGLSVRSVILEDIRSLWNVGSIFRTADGAGFSHIYLCGITGTPPRKEIAKTSLGAEEAISWSFASYAIEVIQTLRAKGVFVIALEYTRNMSGIRDSELLTDFLLTNGANRPYAIIVGNEVSGLSAEVLNNCDAICHLPMRGHKQSLNVAVAFGIAAYLCTDKDD